jgi:REP element-mobilizing transposase RayT
MSFVTDPKGWHSRGYVPHFDSQDATQFATFRLAGSLPSVALDRIEDSDRPESLRDEYLDRGWGDCWLRQDDIAELVETAFLAFDGSRYRLLAWTIMPNHVHVLFMPMAGEHLGRIISSWKRFTAREANLKLGRTGAFWQPDYWDRFIGNDDHYEAIVSYIDLNPVKARLVEAPALWRWGSARRRGA